MKALRILGWLFALAVLAVGGAVAALMLMKPDVRPPSAETVERTPERLARGKYLVHHVADCLPCHSDVHGDKFAIPVKAGTEGQGGYVFDQKLGVPGRVQAQNITSDPEFGLGSWSDGEVVRAVREGINRKGEALFPMMPYAGFHEMSDEDVRSVVVYLRTLKPVHNRIPPRQLDFPVNLLVRLSPKPVTAPVASPDPKDTLAYGKYLVTIAGCRDCHTPHDDKGQLIPGMDYSGGWLMVGPWGRVVTANLTPDPDQYMGKATREEFIGRFKSFEYLSGAGENTPVAPPGKNTVMAWTSYSGMTPGDLGAIYDYLKTVKPIKNKISSFPDAKN